ncbi:hypothetical protein WS63_11640 [Burkholderia stagnalis]|nr:hypothetical protein WS63_11640 [Burkholderia stagnalis]NOK44144.1 hypothetical protein [Burkholderia thailandensis]
MDLSAFRLTLTLQAHRKIMFSISMQSMRSAFIATLLLSKVVILEWLSLIKSTTYYHQEQ